MSTEKPPSQLGIRARARQFVLTRYKELNELAYWAWRKARERQLGNDHYRHFYTAQFGIQPEFYAGKKLLDIGCGPRGSLEWADMAAERVGLDPLAKQYLRLGAKHHRMSYVAAASEAMPFADRYFDVAFSFNSLDHVEDLAKTVSEIKRVLKPGGLFLLITDVNHEPTACEPQRLTWETAQAFAPELELLEQADFERQQGVYDSLKAARRYDHADPTPRYGILTAKLRRRAS